MYQFQLINSYQIEEGISHPKNSSNDQLIVTYKL